MKGGIQQEKDGETIYISEGNDNIVIRVISVLRCEERQC